MRRVSTVYLLLLLSLGADGRAETDGGLDEAACRAALAALPRPPLLRAAFTQEKTLPDVAKPMRAEGELVVAAEHGVILRTLRPAFAQATRVIALPRTAQPAGNLEARIGRMVQAVLCGDFGPLSEHFVAHAARRDGKLHVRLDPKSAQTKEVIAAITLRLGEHLEEILVEEASGGRIRLSFSGFRTAPPLDADELRGFGATR
jgi:hypothetical protein